MRLAHHRSRWGLRKLSTQLVLGVSALVSALVLALGALSIYTLHAYVTAMGDNAVRSSLAVFQHMYDGSLASAAVRVSSGMGFSLVFI